MKVLIVDAFAAGSGRQAFLRYEKVVRAAFETVEMFEQGGTEFLVRGYNKLEEFCHDNEAAGLSSKAAIAAVDKLDFVFVDGDSRLLPWHPRARKLVVFLRTIIGAHKCLFAAGPGALVVAYVCANGGKKLRVLNGGGDGGSLLELPTVRPEDLRGTGKPKGGGEAVEVALDSSTGDYYGFDRKTNRWTAEGNVGIQKITNAGIGGVAGAILADASVGFEGDGFTKKGWSTFSCKVPVNDMLRKERSIQRVADVSSKTLQRPNTPRFQSEVLVRVRPKRVQHRFLKHVPCGEFLAWSPGKWGIGEMTAVRCRHTFTVLASSARAGPEIVEIHNCLATRFNVRHAYEHSTTLLRAFVQHKHLLIREQNRLDRNSGLFVNRVQAGEDFDGMSFASSHGHVVSASATVATLDAPNKTAARRRQPQGRQKDAGPKFASGKRPAPFPRRPQPADKPRFAPPHSNRTIRAPPSAGRGLRGANPPAVADIANAAGFTTCEVDGGMGDGPGTFTAVRVGDEASDARGALTTHQDEARTLGGVISPRKSRGADSVGRRRALMARVGAGIGVDLSRVMDALLEGGDGQGLMEPNNGQPPHTARTIPAAFGQTQTLGDSIGHAGIEFGELDDGQNQGSADESASRRDRGQDFDDDKAGSTNDGSSKITDVPVARARPCDEVETSRRARTVVGGGTGAHRRRRNVASAIVRIPGHDRKRPYNTFHRFLLMEQQTKKIFFTLDGGGVYDGVEAGGQQDSRTQQAAAVAAERSQQKERRHDENRDIRQRFSANFGIKQAWPSAQKPEIRTQGPYYRTNGGAPRQKSANALHMSANPKRWKFSGAKTRGWSGIGEGAGVGPG